MKAFRFIGEIFIQYPLLMVINILLVLSMAAVDVASIITLAPVVDVLTKMDMQSFSSVTNKIIKSIEAIGIRFSLYNILLIFLFMNVIKSGLTIWVEQSILKTKYVVVRDIMVSTFSAFFNARWFFFSNGKQGTFLNTFIREITIVGDAFGAMARYFARILQIIIYFVVPFYISWRVTIVCLVFAIIFALPFLMLGKISIKLGRKNTATANKVSAVIQESLSSAKVILGFGNQKKSTKNLESAFDAHRKVSIKSQTLGIAIPQMYFPLGLIVLFFNYTPFPQHIYVIRIYNCREPMGNDNNCCLFSNILNRLLYQSL